MKKRYLFASSDLAARAFGCEALPLTAVDARERGAVLHPVFVRVNGPDGDTQRVKKYTYGKIFTGGHNNVVADVILRYLLWFFVPKTISFLHTHPSCSGHRSEQFSEGDEMVARLPGVDFMYLASPGGNLYKYDGKKGERNANGLLILQKIFDDMPRISNKTNCKAGLPRPLSRIQAQKITEKNTDYMESIRTNV